jgi:hypothetical protein
MSLKGNTMSMIPVSVTEAQFCDYIEPSLSKAKRGYVCRIALFAVFNYILYKVHTGCQWSKVPIDKREGSDEGELSWWAIYYHCRKWSKDGSLENVFKASIFTIQEDLDLSEVNLDGSHTIAKKGGESVVYQGRKKAKTCNLLPLTEACGFVIGLCHLLPGNHNDSYNLKPALSKAFKGIKRLGLDIQGAFFNADAGFDTKDARKVCFNHGLIPISLKTFVIAKRLNQVLSVYSTKTFTNTVSFLSVPSPGWTSFVIFSFVLTVKMSTSSVLTLSPLP